MAGIVVHGQRSAPVSDDRGSNRDSIFTKQSITEDIRQFAWPQVGELGVLVQDAFAKEAALLQNPPGCTMLGVTNRVESPNPNTVRDTDHCL
jgi:hypothetical protein